MLREKIANVIKRARNQGWEAGLLSGEYADQILSLFQAEIEKLGVIKESELFPIVGKRTDKLATLIAQAQLAKDKEDLLKTLEGK